VFQLHPNGWRFVAGHVPKLELLGQSVPYGRASNGVFTVTVSRLELRLPVREAPGGGLVKARAPAVLPPAEPEPHLCALAPRTGCRSATAPGAARLAIGVGRRGELDRLAWRWSQRGATAAADFGNPMTTTDFALCLYDGESRLIGGAVAPAGGTCGGRPCWTATGRGFRYADRRLAETGLSAVDLRAGEVTALGVAGRGPRLGVPALPVDPLPLAAQLVSGGGTCWAATFGAVRKNTTRLLKAVSD
jgi:hypothetical protein